MARVGIQRPFKHAFAGLFGDLAADILQASSVQGHSSRQATSLQESLFRYAS